MITDERLREIESRQDVTSERIPSDRLVLWAENHLRESQRRPLSADEKAFWDMANELLESRTDIPDLIAALREAQAENTRMSEALSLIAANLSENPREDAHAALSRDAGREG